MNYEQIQLPKIIIESRVPQSEAEAAYLALVRLCHARQEWYPEVTHDQITTQQTAQRISYPAETHPVLEDVKYHRYGQHDQPLNKRGRRKLAWMQHHYDQLDKNYWEVNGSGMDTS